MVSLEFFLLVSLLAVFVSSSPVCQLSNNCHLSNGTLRCTNWNSSQALFIKHCPNLQIKSLDLSSNNISRVVETAEQVDPFSMEIGHGDQEVMINTDFLADLERIDLSYNQLQSFPSELTNIPALKELDLSGNRLKTLKNLKLKDVKVLNISNNLIYKIEPNTFKDSPKLEILDLSKNSQTQIDKSIFTGVQRSLRQLDLSSNDLTRVHSNAFSELEELKRLGLSQNNMVNIDGLVFPYHLRILELNNNSLQDLDDCSFQHLMDIEHLDLRNNPLNCSCHIYSIFKSFGSRLYTNQNFTCRNPADDQNIVVPIKSLEARCSTHYCISHSAVSESYPKLNLTINIAETVVKIKWRSSLSTQQFYLQINDSSNEVIDSIYIAYDRQYEFKSNSNFASYHICIAALNDQKEILRQVCDVAQLSNKNIIIGISAGVIALLPCVALLIYIVSKDKKYREEVHVVDSVLVKKPIVEKEANANGVNQGFEQDEPKTVPQATPPTENQQDTFSHPTSTDM